MTRLIVTISDLSEVRFKGSEWVRVQVENGALVIQRPGDMVSVFAPGFWVSYWTGI